MSVTMKLEGFDDFEKSLEELSQAAGKGSIRRAMRKSAQPMADHMESLAAERSGEMKEGIGVSTKLSKRQAKLHRKMFRNDRAAVEMFVGAGPDPQATKEEFGSVHNVPRPFVRPAWDAGKDALLKALGREMWADIEKTIKRAKARAAKAGR